MTIHPLGRSFASPNTVLGNLRHAALRSAAVAGLGDLVRQKQDTGNRLAALYESLTRKLNEGQSQLPVEVVRETLRKISDMDAEVKQLDERAAASTMAC